MDDELCNITDACDNKIRVLWGSFKDVVKQSRTVTEEKAVATSATN